MQRYHEERKPLKYRYYQTPDGEEYFQKLWWLMQPSLDWGMFAGVTDCIILTKPEGWIPLLDRFARVSIRPVVTAVLFETSVYMATKLRQKDDGINHAIGGAVCGYYWSRFIAFHPISVPLTLLACSTLWAFKTQKMKGAQFHYEDFDEEGGNETGAWARFNTWSTSDKFPRTWLTAEEAAARGIQT